MIAGLLAFVVGAGVFLPRGASAQQQMIHFNIGTPRGMVSPMFARVSEYYPDPAVYEQWWREIAACQGLPLPPQHVLIAWVQVNAIHFVDADRDQPDSLGRYHWVIGKSYLELGIIMIAMPYLYTEEAIKHEMTHFLIYWSGEWTTSDHPRLHFDGRCGVYETYPGRPPV